MKLCTQLLHSVHCYFLIGNTKQTSYLQEGNVNVISMDECRGTWGSYVYYGSMCIFKWGTTACQVIIYTIEQYLCLYMGKGGVTS